MARATRTGSRADLALLIGALAISVVALVLPDAVAARVQGSVRGSIAAPLVALQSWAARGRTALTDHGSTVARVDSLALAAQDGAAVRAENARLRAMLGLGSRLQWGFVVADVMPPQLGADDHTVLLGVGSAAGARPFSPLVTPEGVVGMITSVSDQSSTAILWTHPDFRASATSMDGAAFGIVSAHLGTGADRFLLELRGVPFRTSLAPGAVIVTSGLGNVFPRGIPIGVVLREIKTTEGWARTYLVRPVVSPDAVSTVAVLLPPRAAAGVQAAWESAAAAEQAQRAVAMAGDSMIADSVRRLERQLAKLDSLRRAAIMSGDSTVQVTGDSSRADSAERLVPPQVVPSATGAPAPSTATPAPPGAAPTGTPPAARAVPPAPAASRPAAAPRSAGAARPDSAAPVRPRARAAARPADSSARSRPDSSAARRRPPVEENPFKLPPERDR